MEPGPARAKANWLRLFSRVRLQLQEVQPCVWMCVLIAVGNAECIFCSALVHLLFELADLLHQPLHVILLPWFFFFLQLFLSTVPSFLPSFWLLLCMKSVLSCVYLIVLVYPLYCFCHFIIFFSVVCHPRSDLHVVRSDYPWLEQTLRWVWSTVC